MAILEDILAQLTRIANAQEVLAGTVHVSLPPPQQQQYIPPVQPPQQQYVAPQQQYIPPQQPMQQPQPPAATGVDADAITALIQPHVENPAIKAALGATMRQMGINALPETQPHQYAELYSRFQAVLAQHAQQPQQPASTSII
jgi:hypothetical protein